MTESATPNGSQQKQSNSDQLSGSLISVITNAMVRYEGTLQEIDRQERAMRLQNVRAFGTEGRRGGKNEIVPQDTVIPEVVFKVDHIKDFQIIKRPEVTPAEKKKDDIQEQDPAIIQTSKQKEKANWRATDKDRKQDNQDDDKNDVHGDTDGEDDDDEREADSQTKNDKRNLSKWEGKEESKPVFNQQHTHNSNAGGSNRQAIREKKEWTETKPTKPKSNNAPERIGKGDGKAYGKSDKTLQSEVASNFDFSQKNLEAEKSGQKAKQAEDGDEQEKKSGAGQAAGQGSGQDAEKKDGKGDGEGEKRADGDESSEDDDDGFFDNISNANDEKRKEMEQMRNKETRQQIYQNRQKNHAKDADTFGVQSSQNFQYHDRGRGRGRGGRGGRGGGRGGNNNRGRGYDGANTSNRGDYQGNYRGSGGQYRGGDNSWHRGGGEGSYTRGGGDNSYHRGGGGGDSYYHRGGDKSYHRGGGDNSWHRGGDNSYHRGGGGDNSYYRGGNNYSQRGNRRGGNSNSYSASTGDPTIDLKKKEQQKDQQVKA